MPVINWKKCYETKVVAIDTEHQELVAQINRLYAAIRQNNAQPMLLSLFDALVDYTRQHFSHEETMMAEYHYPQLPEHQDEHALLTEQVLDYRKQLAGGSTVSASEVMGFLRDWLLDHIVKCDIPYVHYIEARAGRFIG